MHRRSEREISRGVGQLRGFSATRSPSLKEPREAVTLAVLIGVLTLAGGAPIGAPKVISDFRGRGRRDLSF
jgi:hypothetical protein